MYKTIKDQIRENETRLIKILDYQAEELEQYKNIIDELEKYCDFQNDKLGGNPLENQRTLSVVNWILNKLKELKER